MTWHIVAFPFEEVFIFQPASQDVIKEIENAPYKMEVVATVSGRFPGKEEAEASYHPLETLRHDIEWSFMDAVKETGGLEAWRIGNHG